MQLKVAKVLNSMLTLIMIIIVGLWALFIFYLRDAFPQARTAFFVGLIVLDLALYFFFKWMERTWDKRVITKMVKGGHVALAGIKGGERIMPMKDSSFTKYWLYSFKAEIYDTEGYKFEKTFYEKMNSEFGAVPQGFVYVTYDPLKPNQIFIVPNVMISHMPQLMPIVKSFEDNKLINIKYLDAYYNKGMVLKTMRQSVKEQTKIVKEMKK